MWSVTVKIVPCDSTCVRGIENLFSRQKDWRRIATRYDRCAHAFRSAILLAATVLFCYES